MQSEENLAHLVHIEGLLGKLSGPRQSVPNRANQSASVIALDATSALPAGALTNWPLDAFCNQTLSSKLKLAVHSTPLPLELNAAIDPLTALFESLVKDIMASRDRLLSLNPGRRKLIEHRLEFIARKIARQRGERLTRSLSLPDVLKESYRDNAQAQTKVLGNLAWKAFVTEVALYNVLELFLLKCLDVYGWRKFENSDLGRLNFAANMFLSQRASGFAHDKHCWNFARTNLYSWYVPSRVALEELGQGIDKISMGWTDREFMQWISNLPESMRLPDFDVAVRANGACAYKDDQNLSKAIFDLLESQLGVQVVTGYQGRPVCRKFFIPALESGATALELLDRLIQRVRSAGGEWLSDEGNQLHRAIWACESESFETFFAEVLALLKTLRTARSQTDWSATEEMYRLPHAMHVVQLLGLELHNLEQLPLGGPEVSKLQQGSAAQIQQLETFDAAIVTDNVDRMKSARWMKALAEQLPYWRTLVGTSTNLNWGELHLHLALTKLKENGYCIYLSHKVLPEAGDGEKLRKSVLGLATLEAFVELNEESYNPYRYLYIFKRCSNKLERDQHRPRFGKEATVRAPIILSALEEANSTQAEIVERGWDHLFVRGAAPLVRHLNHKFPKLFQIATIQAWSADGNNTQSFFTGTTTRALELRFKNPTDPTSGISFEPVCTLEKDKLYLFPHNPVDLSWIQCLLASAPAQFWMRHQVFNQTAAKQPRLHDMRSCPIVDLSHAPADAVHDALEWMGQIKPDSAKLRAWACHPEMTVTERQAKFVAMAKRFASLERIVARYRPLFVGPGFEELRPEAITQFYPAALLCQISQSPDLRLQYVGRERCNVLPENWSIVDVHSVMQTVNGKPAAFIVIHMRQGPSIQLLVPASVREYMTAQLKELRGHTWSEATTLLRMPRDVSLFAAQTAEITRVVFETAQELEVYARVLDELALDLFEIAPDMRQFLPH